MAPPVVVSTDGDLAMEGPPPDERFTVAAQPVEKPVQGNDTAPEPLEKEEPQDAEGPTAKQRADWSEHPEKGTNKCWNPRCYRNATVDSEYKGRRCCEPCREHFYSVSSFCPGCGLGYEFEEAPENEANPFIGCSNCDHWVHRKCEDPALKIGMYDGEFLMRDFYCFDCRATKGLEIDWRFPRDLLLEGQRDGEAGVLILKTPFLWSGVHKKAVHPIIIVGFDFRHDREDKRVVISMMATKVSGEELCWTREHLLVGSTRPLPSWETVEKKKKTYSKPRGVWAATRSLFDASSPVIELLSEEGKELYSIIVRELEEWQEEYDALLTGAIPTNYTDVDSSDEEDGRRAKRRKVDQPRSKRGRARRQQSARTGSLSDVPWTTTAFPSTLDVAHVEESDEEDELDDGDSALQVPSVVWARMPGKGPSWTPAVLTHVLKESTSSSRYMVYFLEREELPVMHLRPTQSVSSVVEDASTVESGVEGSVKESESAPAESSEVKSETSVSAGENEAAAAPSSTEALGTEDQYGRPISQWLRDALQTRLTPAERERNCKYNWLERNAIQAWSCDRKPEYERIIKRAPSHKRRHLLDAILFGDAYYSGKFDDWERKGLPTHIYKDYLRQKSVQEHIESQGKFYEATKNTLSVMYMKCFLEMSLIELHWRCACRTRQFVKAVRDDHYGGWHLIAAQDWPTDEQIDEGLEEEVILVYAGTLLTYEEAMDMERRSEDVHTDLNRYVAEVPNSNCIWDFSRDMRLLPTEDNFFVDGRSYADPTTPWWSPGPTVNHERVEYCKLEPRHCEAGRQRKRRSDEDSPRDWLRGFWLQRKKGEVITCGEPLFWSYDGGAGKFDRDFNLIGAPPPQGWISTAEIKRTGRHGRSARSQPSAPNTTVTLGGSSMRSTFSEWFPLVPARQLNLRLTLFSGQVFVWKALNAGTDAEVYCGVIGSTAVRLRNTKSGAVDYSCCPAKNKDKARRQLWDFFQLDTDIDTLYDDWEKRDRIFRTVVQDKCIRGLRVIHQEPFECLVSFITSQNNNVKRISLLLNSLRQRFGTHLATLEPNEKGDEVCELYQFPSLKQFEAATEEDFRKMGFGYRARYLHSLIATLKDDVMYEKLHYLNAFEQEQECRKFLTSFVGVGRKVADCVALFSMRGKALRPGMVAAFGLRNYMGSKKTPNTVTDAVHEDINATMRSVLGDYAGWAHSILFTAELMANPHAEANKASSGTKSGVKRGRE
ncbi:8-oxoguanine glycosylase ogg1 [Perkinsus chesapeaki]|uniref:DNA-(apurinic or apyrimidinic site) lyase n=1 Tax=Perkinsus chesapeaki TaxID=330153 RepID=A0A7J6LKR3_PERCH|nr:8-oxoguanine glycosylase ogg1 [Perkinsus chesapeaki]